MCGAQTPDAVLVLGRQLLVKFVLGARFLGAFFQESLLPVVRGGRRIFELFGGAIKLQRSAAVERSPVRWGCNTNSSSDRPTTP